MPNLYITPEEIKSSAPEIIQPDTTRYDAALIRLSDYWSRIVDDYCNFKFYPLSETRYYDGSGNKELRIDEAITISALEYSDDNGLTYTALTESGNWIPTVEGDYNHPGSYNILKIDANSSILSAWPSDQRGVKVTGVFAYSKDRDKSWEDSQDEVENAPLAAGGTSLTVNDVDGANLYGGSPRLHAGLLIRIESEYCEIVNTNTEAQTATIIRGRNGTTAAVHVQDKQIDIWRAPGPIKQATGILVVRAFERALQGYGDTRAQPDVGQLFFLRKIDPEAQELLNIIRYGTSK